MADDPPRDVGLAGDGDEIAAISDVEAAFGVKLDYADVSRWVTAGDVFQSLQNVLPADERNNPDLWARFAVALCGETGVNPNDIGRNSPLLSQSRLWEQITNAPAAFWIVILLGAFLLAVIFLG